MPYQPTNPYPYNTAIDLNNGLQFRFKIDNYDVIESFKIDIYDYYKNTKMYTIIRSIGDIDENNLIVNGDKQLIQILDNNDNELLLEIMEETEEMKKNNSILPINGKYNQVNIGQLELNKYIEDIEVLEKIKYYPNVENVKELTITPSECFEINEDGIIISYDEDANPDLYNIVIPYQLVYTETGELKQVKGINGTNEENSQQVFTNNSNIQHITIPNTVLELNEKCFSGCENLQTVTLNYGIKYIKKECFKDDKQLNEINLFDTIAQIGESAFEGCTGLSNILLPYNLKNIEQNAFKNTGIQHLVLPTALEKLSNGVFQQCENLLIIDFNEKLKVIGESCFEGCVKLEKIETNKNLQKIERNAFANCTNLTEVILSDSLANIASCLGGCYNLLKITLPFVGETQESNKTFDSVFGHLFSTEENEHMCLITQQYDKDQKTTYYVPFGLSEIKLTNCLFIPYGGFCDFKPLRTINLPEQLQDIQSYGFWNCIQLQEIVIPQKVTNIGECAFGVEEEEQNEEATI